MLDFVPWASCTSTVRVEYPFRTVSDAHVDAVGRYVCTAPCHVLDSTKKDTEGRRKKGRNTSRPGSPE
jgi:hypothetical protein